MLRKLSRAVAIITPYYPRSEYISTASRKKDIPRVWTSNRRWTFIFRTLIHHIVVSSTAGGVSPITRRQGHGTSSLLCPRLRRTVKLFLHLLPSCLTPPLPKPCRSPAPPSLPLFHKKVKGSVPPDRHDPSPPSQTDQNGVPHTYQTQQQVVSRAAVSPP